MFYEDEQEKKAENTVKKDGVCCHREVERSLQFMMLDDDIEEWREAKKRRKSDGEKETEEIPEQERNASRERQTDVRGDSGNRWYLPLLLLGVACVLCYWWCRKWKWRWRLRDREAFLTVCVLK